MEEGGPGGEWMISAWLNAAKLNRDEAISTCSQLQSGITDKGDEFLRSFRLPLPPLHTHSEVALNWLLAGGRQTTNLFQRRVCARRLWCLHITSEARRLTVGCGWEPWWWTGHRCIQASTPLPSSHAGRGESWEFSLLLPAQI